MLNLKISKSLVIGNLKVFAANSLFMLSKIYFKSAEYNDALHNINDILTLRSDIGAEPFFVKTTIAGLDKSGGNGSGSGSNSLISLTLA